MAEVVDRACADAQVLIGGGMHALLLENHGDVPFTPQAVEPSTIAAMTAVAVEVRRAVAEVPMGINVLKNDARAALAIATAVGAAFIRVNVHAGAVVADQGIVQSDAYRTLRDRRMLGADVRLFADVQGKHAAPLAPVELEQEARDLVHRGLADGLVVSGRATGEATAIGDVKRVRSAVPSVPLLVGSGVTPDTAAELLSIADALIVGTYVKRDGQVRNAVDPDRVARLVGSIR